MSQFNPISNEKLRSMCNFFYLFDALISKMEHYGLLITKTPLALIISTSV